jgi:hypothetical protein|tara:strand:+ start:221 stop:496 length:276 start_codon:yes stop_codon:yes gene_type:complete
VRTFSVTRRKERKARARVLSLFVPISYFRIFLSLGVWRSLRQQEKRDRPTKKGKREKRVFVWFEKARLLGRRRRSSLYIFIREEDGAAITA